MTDIPKDVALRFFLAGFAASSEGYNPDVLADWGDPDHHVRELFEENWPVPEYEDRVTDGERQAEFNRLADKHGLYAALPKVGVETGETIPPFAGTEDEGWNYTE